MAQPVQPLGYAAPSRRRFAWVILPTQLGFCIAGISLIVISAAATRCVEPLYRDFKLDLPIVTKLMLACSRFLIDDFGWIGLAAVVFGLPIALAKVNRHDDGASDARVRFLLAANISLTVSLLITLLAAVAAFAPFITFMTSVSSPTLPAGR